MMASCSRKKKTPARLTDYANNGLVYDMKITTLYLLAAASLITACSKPAEDPQQVATQYWQLIQSGNTAAAEKLVSRDSLDAFQESLQPLQPGQQFMVGQSQTTVETQLTPGGRGGQASEPQVFSTVLVLEHGRWKIDARQTRIPPEPVSLEKQSRELASKLSHSLDENIDSIDHAMHEGLELLNHALKQSSNEMSESLLNAMKELNESMQRSIENMKKRRQQQSPQPTTPGAPATPDRHIDSRNGEGRI